MTVDTLLHNLRALRDDLCIIASDPALLDSIRARYGDEDRTRAARALGDAGALLGRAHAKLDTARRLISAPRSGDRQGAQESGRGRR